jgi:hypothetical protein
MALYHLLNSEENILTELKRQEVAGGWRRLHNEELHNLYTSPDVIRVIKSRRMRWTRHVVRTVEMRNMYKVLVKKSERKKPLRRTGRRWKDNIKWILEKKG